MNRFLLLTVLVALLGSRIEAGTNCNFENSRCSWKQLSSDSFDWTRQQGPSPTTLTGPDFDHTKGTADGYYMYTEVSPSSWPFPEEGDNAILRSPNLIEIEPTDTDQCFQFWYHMYGINIGTLNVYLTTSTSDVDPAEIIWSQSGEKGNCWIEAEIHVTNFISTTTSAYFAFEGVIGNGYFGDIAIDDVSYGRCVSTTVGCDIEQGICDWEQAQDDDFDWTRWQGRTPTEPTGPDGDHTTHDGSGYYMYAESSWPRTYGDRAALRSPPVSPPSTCGSETRCFQFWFHMLGVNMGTLNVYFNDESAPLWSRTIELGDCWAIAQVEIPPGVSTGTVVIEAVIGHSYIADIAIDDLVYGACNPDIPTTPTCDFAPLPTTTNVQTTTLATTTVTTTTTQPSTTNQQPTTTTVTNTQPITTDSATTRATTTQPTITKAATTQATTTQETPVIPTTTNATTTCRMSPFLIFAMMLNYLIL